MPPKKLQLIIRDAGVASRRDAELMIREGSVTVNGRVVLDPATLADPDEDHIKVSGKLLRPSSTQKVYYIFNKPRNVVSTLTDPEGRPCLGDLLGPLRKGLFPVGRLDFDAEGLMVLTNDGALAQRLSHPSFAVPRTYLVKVKGNPDETTLAKIRRGMNIGEGDRIGEIRWEVIGRQQMSTWIKVVLFEGKKNELKRIFSVIRHPVRKIRRISFGPFSLGQLPVGSWRPLTASERTRMASLVGSRPKPTKSSRPVGKLPARKRRETPKKS
jgi:23S rRNA pseudouridine2605 synthase